MYRELLDNYEYPRLSDASKAHLIGIWLLPAELDNRIPCDADFIGGRISAKGAVELDVFMAAGFIEMSDD